MKKLIQILILVISTLIFTNTAQAQPFGGSDLTYENIGGSLYQVNLTNYRDCSVIPAPSMITIYFECSNNPSYNFNTVLNSYGSEVEITNACPQVNTSCNGGSSSDLGISKVTYQASVTLPPGNWNMYIKNCCRWPVITMLSSGAYYTPAELNNQVVANSCPVYNSDMVPVGKLDQLNRLDYGGIDPDGDSLSYSLYAPYASGPSPLTSVIYNIPYSENDFLPSSTPIILNPTTGILTFTPTQILTALIGIKVEQWRNINGVMTIVGVNYRDLNVEVVNPYSNSPVLSGIDTSLAHIYSANDTIYTLNKCFDGNPIAFSINGNDSDIYSPTNTGSPELFDISWNSGISDASFTPFNNGTDSAYAEFYWLPSNSDIGSNNSFTATIKDYACAYNLLNSYNYNVNIIDNIISIGDDTTICFGEILSVNSISNNSYDNYTWSIDGNAYISSSVDSVVLPSSILSPGNHTLKLETQGGNNASGCDNTQEITITVVDIHIAGSIADTSCCFNNPITFDAGDATAYHWTDFSGAQVSVSQYYTPLASGTYSFTAQNQFCESGDTFEVTIIPSPPAFKLGNDTTIANNESITLSMPSGYSDYIWSNGSTNNTLVIDNSFNWINTITGSIIDTGSCTSTDTIMVYIGNVGINNSNKDNIKIYPNPIDDVLNIKLLELNSKAKLELYNANGKLVRTAEFSTKEYTLNGLSSLAAGNYFMKITVNNKESQYSIIKK